MCPRTWEEKEQGHCWGLVLLLLAQPGLLLGSLSPAPTPLRRAGSSLEPEEQLCPRVSAQLAGEALFFA